MKLLGVSILLNIALLVALALQPSFAPPHVREFLVHRLHFGSSTDSAPSIPPRAREASGAATAPALTVSLGAAFPTDDIPTLSARMRAAGFPVGVIVEILRREIDTRYDARLRALLAPDPTLPFWKTSLEAVVTSGRRGEQLSQLFREREKAYRDAVNDPFFFQDAALDIGQRRMWGDLPRAKLDRIQSIEDDYTEMMSAAQLAANGVVLAADRAKLDLLEREKQADIAATLSPAELAEYQLRTESVNMGFTRRLSFFQPSESEWRALARSQIDLNAQFAATGGLLAAAPEQRTAALQSFEREMRATLGEARFAEYLRTTSPEFQQLTRFTEVDKLPASVATQAFAVRERVANESNRIFDDPTLDNVQKRAALQALSQTTRTQLLSLLGPTSGPAYVKTAESWLGPVASGSAVTFSAITPLPTGNGKVTLIGSMGPTLRRLPGTAPTAPGSVIINRGP